MTNLEVKDLKYSVVITKSKRSLALLLNHLEKLNSVLHPQIRAVSPGSISAWCLQPTSTHTPVPSVPILATTIPLLKKGKKSISGQSYSRRKEGVSSVGELPAVGGLLANVFEDFGLLDFLGFLVAEAAAASSLFKLAIIAVHVQINKRRHLETKRQSNLRQI